LSNHSYRVHIAKLNLYISKYSVLLRVLDVYKLIVFLEPLYRVHIGKLNLYISKYSVLLRVLDVYKLIVLLELLYKEHKLKNYYKF